MRHVDKLFFRISHIKKEGFIKSGLSLTLDANRVEKAKTGTLTGIIHGCLKSPLGIKL